MLTYEEVKAIVQRNALLVDAAYPGLRNSNRWEWNHKVAYLSYKETGMVGQKSTDPNAPVSEDTIGILNVPLFGNAGQNYYPYTFMAVDLVNGTTGAIQWLEHGIVTQNYIIPTVADLSAIGENPIPTEDTIPWTGYWGDPLSDKAMRTLMYDFSRRPEAYNPGMGRWISRLIHSATMGPLPPSQDGQPLGFEGALNRHRPEWCAALGGLDPNVPVPDTFFPEYK